MADVVDIVVTQGDYHYSYPVWIDSDAEVLSFIAQGMDRHILEGTGHVDQTREWRCLPAWQT